MQDEFGTATRYLLLETWLSEKVKTREEVGDIWDAVYEEITTFDDTYQMVVCETTETNTPTTT